MEKTKKTELAVIPELQPELLSVAEKSGIVITEAQFIGFKFKPFMDKVNEISLEIAKINTENPTEEDARTARRHRLDLVLNRGKNGLEATHKDLKIESLVRGRLIDNYRNVVESSSILSEQIAEKIEKHQERIESERKNKLSESRKLELEPFEVDTTYLPLAEMQDNVFSQLLSDSKLLFETKKKQAEDAEKARIEAGKLEAEKLAEEKRLEAERIEAQRIENEKLKAEAERLQKAQAIKDAENKKESDRLAKIAADAKAEADKLAKELQTKKDAEELAHKKEKERIEAEESERKAAEKAKQLAPDKEKIRMLFEAIKAIEIPEFKSKEAIEIGEAIKEGLAILKAGLIEKSKKLM